MSVNTLTKGTAGVGRLLIGGKALVFSKAGAPVDGTSGDGAGKAGPGSLLIDVDNKKLYQNTNTKASPTWSSVGDIATADLADGSVTTAKLAVPKLAVLSEVVTAASLTDGGAAVGTKALAGQIPAGAIILGTKVTVEAGFAGDVSAVATIGDGVDADRYMTGTPSVFGTDANGIQTGAPSGDKLQEAAVSPVVTVTSAADITPVLAGGGSMTVRIYYIQTA